MVPKKPSDISKIVSEDLDISERLVDKLVDFYYKELRTKMSNLEDSRYYVPGLGVFTARLNKIQKAISKLEIKSKYMRQSTMAQYMVKKNAGINLEKLKALEVKMLDELETYNTCKNGKANDNMEK